MGLNDQNMILRNGGVSQDLGVDESCMIFNAWTDDYTAALDRHR